ncbi:MAG: large repetitive protein, partial [Chloroflexota bacterium]|nr:large repetitive protein [Chloroflexota bacterium]
IFTGAAPAPAAAVPAPPAQEGGAAAEPAAAPLRTSSAPGASAPAAGQPPPAVQPLQVSVGPDQVITEGGGLYASGSFHGGLGAWSATVDYGDGAPAEMLPLSGQFFTVNHAYRDVGQYTVTVLVRDAHQQLAAGMMRVTVTNYPTAVHVPSNATYHRGSGKPFTASGTFDDPGDDNWNGSVACGDGTGSRPLALSGHSFTLSHTFATNGTYWVTVKIVDDDGYTGVGTIQVQVVD